MQSIRLTVSTVGLAGLLTLSGCPPQDQEPSAGPAPFISQPVARTTTPPQQPQPETDETVATIHGLAVTMQQLQRPLVEAFGLNMLLKLVELDLAKQQAQFQGITLTQKDFDAEVQRYLDAVFKDDKHISDMRDDLDLKTSQGKTADAENDRRAISQEQQRLLTQLLDNQKLTRAEFDLAMETTAYLRAIVQPAVLTRLTDENLQQSFRARYGEKVRVRHIACANMQEIDEAKRRLAGGEPFAQVAEELSRDQRTRAVGGELPAFSRNTSGVPQVFKDAAFELQKPGDISDPVEADGAYHLIQLQEKIAPVAVKFEDVKQSVREDLAEALTQASVKELRAQLGQQALKDLRIQNPVLAKQFADKVSQRNTEIRGQDQIRRELDSEHKAAAATEPTPEASGAPASTSTTRP